MLNLRVTFLAVAALALGACSDSSPTTVVLDVDYSDSIAPDAFRIVAREATDDTTPEHEIRVFVPDDWAGEPLDISLDAMNAGHSIAHGATQVTPIAGDEVHGSITLANPDCEVSCTPGAKRCDGDAVVTCGTGEDGCPLWGEPVACDTATPSCSNGACAATCVDECAAGGARCVGNQVQICGQADSDSCLDWKTPTTCGGGETCSNGTCATTCTDECNAGAYRCDMNGVEQCGNSDADSCTEWGLPSLCEPPAPTCADANTLRTYTSACQVAGAYCANTPTDTTCANGCTAGACNGDAKAVDAGDDTTCKLELDGTVQCWGRNLNGVLSPPSGAFTKIDGGTAPNGAGQAHFCALRADGSLACWGYNAYGQTTPVAGTYSQVSVGGYHTCALRTNGTIACWGYNYAGQTTPPGGTFTKVEAGGYNSCALSAAGAVTCWGENDDGESVPPAGTFKDISGGDSHFCAIKTDNSVVCWGRSSYGELNVPAGSFASIAGGGLHTCGVKTDGTVACWGRNINGESTPPAGTFASVTSGWEHSCGVTPSHAIRCWGHNTYGQVTVP